MADWISAHWVGRLRTSNWLLLFCAVIRTEFVGLLALTGALPPFVCPGGPSCRSSEALSGEVRVSALLVMGGGRPWVPPVLPGKPQLPAEPLPGALPGPLPKPLLVRVTVRRPGATWAAASSVTDSSL